MFRSPICVQHCGIPPIGKVYFVECRIFGRCILQDENLRKMMVLLLLSFLVVFVHWLKIVS